MTRVAIRVENLSKVYRIGLKEERAETLFGSLANFVKAPLQNYRRLRALSRFSQAELDAAEDVIWALRDVSFEVKEGEVLGIIGANGAGKSTLLKILAGITEPTHGRAELHGRVASLLEVGTGFHPDLTGRENIYLNGTLLGMRKAEIDAKLDEIIDFSGVEKFIDTPVKRYSSGMKVRLAFAVAAHLDPEILLIDEVLAVGDAAFQQKCLGKMEEVAKGGRTVLFVSHNMAAVTALCERGVVLERGYVGCNDDPQAAVRHYLESLNNRASGPVYKRTDRSGTGGVRVTNVSISNLSTGGKQVRSADDLAVSLGFEVQDTRCRHEVVFSVTVLSEIGSPLMVLRNDYTGEALQQLPMTGTVTCVVPRLPLVPGLYLLNTFVEQQGTILDWVRCAAELRVIEGDFYGTGRSQPSNHAPFLVDHHWKLEP